jgi:hypothetical protein
MFHGNNRMDGLRKSKTLNSFTRRMKMKKMTNNLILLSMLFLSIYLYCNIYI